jgi:hypothetical protein
MWGFTHQWLVDPWGYGGYGPFHIHRVILVIAFMAGVAWRVVSGDMLRGEAFHQELGRSGCDSWSDTNPVISKSFTTKKAMRVDFAKQFTKDC